MEQLTDIQEQILNGHLLGDGSLRKASQKSNTRFSLTRKIEDKNYLLWTAKHFENFLYETGVSEYGYLDNRTQKIYPQIRLQTTTVHLFTEYYHKWYPEGKKIVPKDLILTPLTIAVWFCDDGNFRSQKTSSDLKFATDGFSFEDVKFLEYQLQTKYGDKIAIKPKGNTFIIRCTTASTINEILNDIYPFFPPMERKLKQALNHNLIKIPEIPDDLDVQNIHFVEKIKEKLPSCIFCSGNNVVKRRRYKENGENKQYYFCKTCKKHYLELKDYKIIPKLVRNS